MNTSPPCQAFPNKLYNKFRNTTAKLHQTILNIKFNRICLSHNVIPNFIHVNVNSMSPAAQRAKHKAEIIWLKQEIKYLHTKKQELNVELYKIHLELGNHIKISDILNDLMNTVKQNTEQLIKTKWEKQQQKINTLLKHSNNVKNRNTTQPNHAFHKRLVNLTDIQFTKQETNLLEKGPKYNVNTQITHRTIENLVTESEFIIKQQERNTNFNAGLTRELIAEEIRCIIKENKNDIMSGTKSAEEETCRRIRNKLKNEGALITKADKGNTMVIMKQDDYRNKTLTFIEDNNIHKLTSDPTQRFHKNTQTLLKSITHIFPKQKIKWLKQKNPKAPTLNCLPKIHKENIPVRPVVNFRNAPTYYLAREIHSYLQKHYVFTNNRSIRNTSELIQKIKHIIIPSTATLTSFDITSMYTNIPITETINIIKQQLQQQTDTPNSHIKETTNILKLITEQNYFTFDNQFYSQEDGLPMGSPVSGLLANIFLNHIENKIFDTIVKPKQYKIIYWHRYVDDIICLLDETPSRIQELHNDINSVHPKIKFTIETENDKKLNFLDLSIHRDKNQHKFSIYRKPTTTSTAIHKHSNNPITQKQAGFQYMLHRLHKTPLSDEQYKNEIQTIKQIATENGYDTNIIDKLNYKIKAKLKGTTNTQKQTDQKHNTTTQNINPLNTHTSNTHTQEQKSNITTNKWHTLTYDNKATHRIGNILKKQGLKVAYRTDNSIQRKLKTTNTNTDKHNTSGIYQLTCQDCNSVYIGQTCRNFNTRYTEHRRALKSNSHSTFAEHLINMNHKPTDINTDLKILKYSKSLPQKLTIEENYHIQKAIIERKEIINEYTALCNGTIFSALKELTENL